jgi:transposase
MEWQGQTEEADEVTVVERQFVLVRHRRQKYRCRCNGCVATAPGPLRLATRPDARGARYSPEFAVEVAVSKYADHLPLERQVRSMRREGLVVDSQTLWDQQGAEQKHQVPIVLRAQQHSEEGPRLRYPIGIQMD